MSIARYVKDPNATLDYQVDWTNWLSSNTISDSQWIVPAGLTKVTDSHTPTSALVRISGGVLGTLYDVINRITTNLGEIDERTIRIKIEDR